MILLTDGKELDMDDMGNLLGYQMIHVETGRLLPLCVRFEIYTKLACEAKMNDVVSFYETEHDISIIPSDYKIEPIYEYEMEGGFHMITTQADWKI